MWGANTFPVRKYNSRTFHLKVRRSRLFRFFRRFPQINVGGDFARIPFVENASRESRVALPPKGCDSYEPEMGLGKDNGGITSLISAKGNHGKFGLGYKPT